MAERSAAQALYGHLPSGERAGQPERKGSVGDAMWPALSRDATAREAAQAKWQAEQKARNARIAADLRELAASIREGKRR